MSVKSYWVTIPLHERMRAVAEDGTVLAQTTPAAAPLGSHVTLRYPKPFHVESVSVDQLTTRIEPIAQGVLENVEPALEDEYRAAHRGKLPGSMRTKRLRKKRRARVRRWLETRVLASMLPPVEPKP